MSIYQYKYFIDGKKLGILQKEINTSYDPYVNYDEAIYDTPSQSDSQGIYVRYTIKNSGPTDENSDLALDDNLERAVLFYVKSEIAQDGGDPRRADYLMRKFHYYVARANNARKGRINKVMPSSTESVR